MRTQQRQPRGRPTGGEFASHERADDDISLGGDQAVFDSDDGATMLGMAKLFAGHYRSSHHIRYIEDADVAQDAVLSILTTRHNTGANRTYSGGLVRSAVRNETGRAISAQTQRRHEDVAALAILDVRLEVAEQDLRRHLTGREIDDLAERIRLGWHDKRHRPTVGFHRTAELKSVRMEYVAREAEQVSADPYAFADPDQEMNAVADWVDEQGTESSAHAGFWKLATSRWGAPGPKPLSRDKRKVARAAIDEAGGVMAVLDRFHTDGQITAGLLAVTAAFHGDDPAQTARELRRALDSRRDYAIEAWLSATRDYR